MLEWNAHRFSGGILALDVINTVVWQDLPSKRTDRLADWSEVQRFARAASVFRSAEVGGVVLMPPETESDINAFLALRNTLDDWLRCAVSERPEKASLQQVFLHASRASANVHTGLSLGEATARSAMQFLDDNVRNKLKICPSCRWLYLDRSKNLSRQWCDMKVCGNRAKARKHYARNKRLHFEVGA
jgi:predicted RNA-binding Zn ribbon-like protein